MATKPKGEWESLMCAANRNDVAAYTRLLHQITPVLRRIVRARGATLGHEGCEDVLQETLLAIHLKRQSWREDAPLRPWLYAITRHKVADGFRARGQRVELSVGDLAEILPAPEGPDPTQMQDMDSILGQLQPRAAEIMRRSGLRGESSAEIGARLGMSEQAVRVALHRARKAIERLRERMME